MNQPILRLHNSLRNEIIENWDDDDLVVGGDDFRLRSSSLTLSATTNTSQHRDSVSSRLSIRSEIESNHGDDERQVHVPGDDERSTIDAILTAKRAGIPLPTDVPASALLGGSIRRLGGKKLGKPIQDDWDDGDIEFPSHGELRIKNYDETSFPDALRQVSGPNSLQGSPIRQIQTAPRSCNSPPITLRSQKNSKTLLDRFKDEVEDENSHSEAIKVFKSRPAPNLSSHVTPPTPCCKQDVTEIEEFEQDFQLPLNDEPLQLSVRKDFPRTPSIIQDEFDEWGEGGSLGTRHGGKRDRGSIRSSSVTAPSPSVSSSLTIESEDEALDGLVLPSGPLRFDEILKKKHQDQTLDSNSEERLYFPEPNDDFLSGLEIGFGDPFDFKKLKVNRNVKIKTTYQTNPVRPKAAVSLTFTKKISNSSNSSRIPRPLSGYERLPSSLEPVSESGGPIVSRIHRSHSRIGCHSSHTSVNSLTTPITPTTISAPPSSPHQREHISNPPFAGLGKEHTATTSAQLLKLKRSMPIIRSSQSNTKAVFNPRLDRPGSYNDGSRPTPFFRPKSPIERGRGAESIHNHVKSHHMPFLPAGASNSQSHHVLAKTSRNFPRHDSQSSSNSVERHPSSRGVSRSTMRSPSPHRKGADALAREAATRRLLTKPVIRRHFGDGCELDAFDDLPISRDSEQRFIKEPLIRGPPKPCIYRKKPQQESRPALSIRSGDHLPRFARDTTASRIAREKTIAQRSQSNHRTPLSTLTNNWKAKLAASTGLNNKKSHPMKPKNGSNASPKPQLIKQIGKSNNPKCQYNFHSSLKLY